ncbi:hypothetical protein WUBG_16704, partial [Wuchereria bancrofti]
MLKTSVYPGASPPRDAPSPTANDDPFREGVEIAFKHSLLVIFVFVYYVLMKTIAEMRGPQCGSSSLLPLPKLIPAKEESVVTPDRRDGEKFMGEIEQSYTKLTDFFGALAKHRKRGQHLLAEIERAKRCFTLQLRDVTVVEDAYQKFGAGIDEVCTEVEEMLKTSVYPGASPPRDAPSPTANDDPFREGVEIAFK